MAGAIVFRLVTTLEAYLRTSGESNHHVRVVKNDALPTTPQGRLQQSKHTRPKKDTDREEVEAGKPPKKQQDTGTERQPKERAATKGDRVEKAAHITMRCVGIVRTMTIFGHLICLGVL